ncbi:MAG: hypothetical protein ACRDYA_23825 [Egibacteraceae bacterium]
MRQLMNGRPLALPSPVDAVSERWARVPPRMRALLVLLAVLAAIVGMQHRVALTQARWGGTPVTVLRAVEDLPAGTPAARLEPIALPPAALPPRAVGHPPDGAVLSLPLPAGSVLTQAHLDPRGPAAHLPDDVRAVPVPVEAGWRIEPGGWVDVWVLGAGEVPSRLVARSRAVLEVRRDEGTRTALVTLHDDEVGPTTEGLALGKVLLTHAPPPTASGPLGPVQ